ncbi:lipoyl(octanoyl) transferase LipB [Nesterenkonia haasae]|uniref:lipoyl(octanoyl) transferase LipB n=1 Tax=Nesterenkonia haasae TaxID=2587813 RepID=UPI001391EBAD|nr:lipoyl(octanoyl) transferase LipB [Nesterenkonia haasae]NDK30461.1 lipoyl(octanoyl) transferase LipB [Nesterenkonia haasae]
MTVLQTRYLGFDPALVDYAEAWELQRRLHSQILSGEADSTLLLLEHADVYTAGKRTEPQDCPVDGTPVIDVDRGGKLTWHGRGQLVGYPLLHLQDRSSVKDYVCTLENVIIKILSENYGISATRVEGRSGVWLTDNGDVRKIAAIGIRVHRSVTMHGFALNCSNDLAPFGKIIPCGISDAATTTISAELGRTVTPADIAPRIAEELQAVLPRYVSSRADAASSGVTDLLTAKKESTLEEEVSR